MQVRQIFAAALFSVSTLGAMGAIAQDGKSNALGTPSYTAHSERSREAVIAELRDLQAQRQWHATGELVDAPVVATVPESATQLTRSRSRPMSP